MAKVRDEKLIFESEDDKEGKVSTKAERLPEHLKPHQWKKGQSGNPAGKKKGEVSYKRYIQEAFVNEITKTGADGIPKAVKFLDRVVASALRDPDGKSGQALFVRMINEDTLDQIDNILTKQKKDDIDYAQYRVFKRAFDIQKDSLLSKKKVKLKCAGRRAGKTESNTFEAVYTACIPNSLVQIIGLSFQSVIQMYFDKILNLLEEDGHIISRSSKNEGFIELDNGSQIVFKGNSTIVEREKLRGFQWDLVIIDEAQSHKDLKYLIEDIIDPTLIDRKGTLILSGSGPRIRGTYWEHYWNTADEKYVLKQNWNLSHNPYIPDHETVLNDILEKKGISADSPLFKREYLGLMDAFDDDALVYRLNDSNYFTDKELQDWIATQKPSDLKLHGGLDYGFTDSDAFVLILTSESSPEKWLVYEHKAKRQSLAELVQVIQDGIEKTKHLAELSYIYCDHNEQKVTQMLSDTYRLPMMHAYKAHKDVAIEVLQGEVLNRHLKVPKGGSFDYECDHTVFLRDEQDRLTRVIDHDSFHPDEIDAVIYALRDYWNWHKQDINLVGDEE